MKQIEIGVKESGELVFCLILPGLGHCPEIEIGSAGELENPLIVFVQHEEVNILVALFGNLDAFLQNPPSPFIKRHFFFLFHS